jgi:uncharacterized protein (DUF1499 family)
LEILQNGNKLDKVVLSLPNTTIFTQSRPYLFVCIKSLLIIFIPFGETFFTTVEQWKGVGEIKQKGKTRLG